jgi:hypothetical protein
MTTELTVKKKATITHGLMKKIKKTLKFDSTISDTPQAEILIDYPMEGEQVHEGSYAIRISTEPNAEVEISINNGEWQPCRESLGYWWFDWQPLVGARCKLVARSRVGKGRWKKSAPRSCQIVNSDAPLNTGLTFD